MTPCTIPSIRDVLVSHGAPGWAHHAPVLPTLLHLRGPAGLTRGNRGMVTDVVWVHGAHPRLQGLVHGQPWARTPTGMRRSATARGTWYRSYAEQALFLNHVLVNPPIDRGKAVHEVEDVYVHVVQERDDGPMVVRGAKMLATGSALYPRHLRSPEQRGPSRGGQGRGLRACASSRRCPRRVSQAGLPRLIRAELCARRSTAPLSSSL